METVNFQCGHCRQLLAVSKQHLGQQVRCPHCQQVVVAPPEAADPPPPPVPTPLPPPDPFSAAFSFSQPRAEEHDSIFSAPAESDDLFGPAPSGRVEMPPDFRPAAPPLPWESPPPPAPPPDQPPQPQMPDLELAPSPPIPGPNDATLTYVPGRTHPASAASTLEATEPAAPAAEQAPPPFPGMDEAEGGTDLASAFTPVRPRVSRGWHIALFIIPLISYSVLATIVAFVYWRSFEKAKAQPVPIDLEMIPDVIGDHPTQQKDVKHTEWNIPSRTAPLPAQLKVGLGKPLRLGELEVTATAVQRGLIEIKEEGKKLSRPERKALKLYLKLNNVSSDLSFYPMDNFFTRATDRNGHAKGDGRQMLYPPYTQLVIAGQRFYGGPAAFDWPGGDHTREYVVGTNYDTLLKPGQEMTTFVCTDPDDAQIDEQMEKHKGQTLLWRVQVRRGSMMFKGHRKPVCAVFGVEFTDRDITD